MYRGPNLRSKTAWSIHHASCGRTTLVSINGVAHQSMFELLYTLGTNRAPRPHGNHTASDFAWHEKAECQCRSADELPTLTVTCSLFLVAELHL